MAHKRKPDQSKLAAKKAAKAALELGAKSGWANLDMKAVAQKSRLKLDTVTGIFPDKWAVLKWVLKDIEQETDRALKPRLGKNWRENLFELMMTRIDIAAPHKKAFASLPQAFRREPKAVLKFSRTFWRTMSHMIDTAHLPQNILRPAAIASFGVLYISVVEVFLKDDTRDHSKTMAALDQRLGWFEKLVDMTQCRK